LAGEAIIETNKKITKRISTRDISECKEQRRSFNCITPTIRTYRTIDGTCNNLQRPLIGASLTQFRRVLPAQYEDGASIPIGVWQHVNGDLFGSPWPSARHLTEQMISFAGVDSERLTHMHMQWGQFLDHDMDLLGMFEVNCTEMNNDINFCFPIKVKDTDKMFGITSQNKARELSFTRSLPICKTETIIGPPSREHINHNTHYIDGSMIYGSDKETAAALRSFRGGLLKTSGTGKGDLPFSDMRNRRGDLLFMAGDTRVNENVALTVMHTLFLREHNRIAKQLSLINPCWDDEKLYQETRKIMGAIIQIITYKEYLPALYGDTWFRFYIGDHGFYSEHITPTISNVFATGPFRFGHSQIRNEFSRLGKLYTPLSIGPFDLADVFFNPRVYFNSGGTDPILRGLVTDKAKKVDEFISEGVASLLLTEPSSVFATDLTALNIQRSRDHAIPSYRTWEKFCFDKFWNQPSFAHPSAVKQFKRLYGYIGFSKGMDLWLAGLAEKHLDGSSIGPTFACLLAETFTAIRDGDWFWWENPNLFTNEQRNTLSKVTLSSIICQSSDGIESIQQNAFKLSQFRVNCNSLPILDLSKWRDEC